MELFRLYLIVGGMPAAVAEYVESNNLRAVIEIQKNIIALYKRDIAKYAVTDKLAIKEIFDIIPSELDAKNKRFILKILMPSSKDIKIVSCGSRMPALPFRFSTSQNLGCHCGYRSNVIFSNCFPTMLDYWLHNIPTAYSSAFLKVMMPSTMVPSTRTLWLRNYTPMVSICFIIIIRGLEKLIS